MPVVSDHAEISEPAPPSTTVGRDSTSAAIGQHPRMIRDHAAGYAHPAAHHASPQPGSTFCEKLV